MAGRGIRIQSLRIYKCYPIQSKNNCAPGLANSGPEELYPTSFIAEETINYLSEHATSHPDKPFILQCSLVTHITLLPPGKYFDMYDPDEVLLRSI